MKNFGNSLKLNSKTIRFSIQFDNQSCHGLWKKQPGPGWDGVSPGHKRVILPRGKYHDYMAPHLDKLFAVMPVSSVWFVTIVDID